ncbi:MAG TPA: hypothetical protein VFI31_23630 [Pirellulales bacterium]|nr:hypothetical protein [Pirellulales bacterium]
MGPKTTEYFDAFQQHVNAPLETGTVGDHCFAAALLVFGAIDGLGRLIHPQRTAGAGIRFKDFLPRLGPKYIEHADRIWDLRNSLAHNAINVAAFLSKAEDAALHHLEVDRGQIFVSTPQLVADFKDAFEALKDGIERDCELADRIDRRLFYAHLSDAYWRRMDVKTTEPPPISFVQAESE